MSTQGGEYISFQFLPPTHPLISAITQKTGGRERETIAHAFG